MSNRPITQTINIVKVLLVLITYHFSINNSYSAPRTLPKEQAAHFCQLFVNESESSTYPLTIYAQHLTTMLCGSTTYQDYTAEQVFTGLIFFFDEWREYPLVRLAQPELQELVGELHSGTTLRVFPHLTNGVLSWYAPTDSIPESVGAEHRRYMQEVFPRLNAEVHAGNWKNVDAFIDRMIEYQCKFGGTQTSTTSPPYIIYALLLLFAILVVFWFINRKKTD